MIVVDNSVMYEGWDYTKEAFNVDAVVSEFRSPMREDKEGSLGCDVPSGNQFSMVINSFCGFVWPNNKFEVPKLLCMPLVTRDGILSCPIEVNGSAGDEVWPFTIWELRAPWVVEERQFDKFWIMGEVFQDIWVFLSMGESDGRLNSSWTTQGKALKSTFCLVGSNSSSMSGLGLLHHLFCLDVAVEWYLSQCACLVHHLIQCLE